MGSRLPFRQAEKILGRTLKLISTPIQNVIGPLGPETPRIYLFCNFFYRSYNFFFNITRKNIAEKFTDIYFCLFYLHLFQKYLGTFWRGNVVQECPQMFTGPVGPVEVFFTRPKPFWGIFTGLGPAVHC